MLIDYVKEVRAEIAEKRDADLKALLAADGGSNHDLIRGRIDGFDRAVEMLTEVLARYEHPDKVLPPSVGGPPGIAGRRLNADRHPVSRYGRTS